MIRRFIRSTAHASNVLCGLVRNGFLSVKRRDLFGCRLGLYVARSTRADCWHRCKRGRYRPNFYVCCWVTGSQKPSNKREFNSWSHILGGWILPSIAKRSMLWNDLSTGTAVEVKHFRIYLSHIALFSHCPSRCRAYTLIFTDNLMTRVFPVPRSYSHFKILGRLRQTTARTIWAMPNMYRPRRIYRIYARVQCKHAAGLWRFKARTRSYRRPTCTGSTFGRYWERHRWSDRAVT